MTRVDWGAVRVLGSGPVLKKGLLFVVECQDTVSDPGQGPAQRERC